MYAQNAYVVGVVCVLMVRCVLLGVYGNPLRVLELLEVKCFRVFRV